MSTWGLPRDRRAAARAEALEGRRLLAQAVVIGLPVTVFGAAVSGTANVPLSGATVATFLDTDLTEPASDFAATILWGDGLTSAGTVLGGSGAFSVTGTHTYAAAGTFATTVFVTRLTDGQTASVTGQAVIAPGAAELSSFPALINASPGVPFQGVAGSFTDTDLTSTPGDFTAAITWGDGHTSPGTVSATPGVPGRFDVTGSNTFLAAGTYPVTVQVQGNAGDSFTIGSTAVVSGPGLAFTGGLDPVNDHSPSHTGGDTNNTQPVFSGTAPPFSLVNLFARRSDVDATLPIGQAIAGSTGQWALTAVPLTNGVYTVTAVVTPPGESPEPPALLANQGRVTIDTAPPQVVGVQAAPVAGFVVTFRDDLSGMNTVALLDPANYTFTGRGRLAIHPAAVTLLPSGGLPTDAQSVLLTLAVAPRVNRLLHTLRVTGSGVVDNAGNSLQSDYHGPLPSANFRAVGNVVLTVGGRAPRGPRHRA